MKDIYDVIIIGGSAAGYTAALTLKTLRNDLDVLLVRVDEKAQVPCAIPYLAATLETCDKNILPDEPLKKLGVEIVVDEVLGIDRENKTIETAKGLKFRYGKLILSTGSTPFTPPIEGTNLKGVYTITKKWEILQELQKAVREAKKIVVIGGGFIGVELADDLSNLKKDVTIVEILPHCLLLNLDEEFAIKVEEILKTKGVKIMTNCRVEAILGKEKVEAVKLSDGKTIPADVVVVAVGVRPNISLAEKAGLKIGERSIAVDEYMRTSDPNIYAIGDCAEKRSFFIGTPTPALLASVAAFEARVAAANIAGLRLPRTVLGVVGVFLTNIGGEAFGAAGLTESAAKRIGFDVITGKAETVDRHPGTMPGTRKTEVKLIFSKDGGYLLGGEACGGSCVGEFINLIGLAIQKHVTLYDLYTMQYGTHPLLTPSPIAYPIIAAALDAYKKLRS